MGTNRSVPPENSLQFYTAWLRAKAPAELHVFAQGSHSNSLDPQFGPTAAWPQRTLEWMQFNGWIRADDLARARSLGR